MLSFVEWPIWINAAIFAVAALIVWRAGGRLTGLINGVANQTGLGKGFAGMLMLGGITSLPEIATVSTSASTGNAALAVNNLLGSASINILLLAVADAVLGRNALTSVIGKPSTLLQGTLGMMLMGVVTLVAVARDIPVFGIGVGSTLLLVMCVSALWLSSGYERRHVWRAIDKRREERQEPADQDERSAQSPLSTLYPKIACNAVLILVSGFVLSQTGDAIAQQSGLGTSLVGLVLVGFATSMPELSSIVAAVRLRQYEMAVGDIFGTNLFNIALIFLADLTYSGGPVLSETGPFEAVAAILAMLLTGVFVLGLLERKDRTLANMGYDSLAAIILYAAGLVVLYSLAPG